MFLDKNHFTYYLHNTIEEIGILHKTIFIICCFFIKDQLLIGHGGTACFNL